MNAQVKDANRVNLVRSLLNESKGKIFSVQFTKKDGSLRRMVARTGVTRHLKGGERAYNPEEKGLTFVFDMQKKAYRSINLSTVTSIRINGKEITIA